MMNDADDDELMEKAFSLDDMLERIRSGRAELLRRRDALLIQRAEVEAELVLVNSDIGKIDALKLAEPPRAAVLKRGSPRKPRTSGVMRNVDQCIDTEDLSEFTIEDFVILFHKVFPDVLIPSIRSALGRLCESGRLEEVAIHNKRGYRVKRRSFPHADATPRLRLDEVRGQVASLLHNAGPEGLTRSQLAWERSDLSQIDEALRDPMFQCRLGTDRWILSSEQRSLFPGADPPE
jgi:hypothetical protein